MTTRTGTFFLLFRLAAQNVGRRRLRTLFLALSVTMAVGVGFAGFVTGWALRDGIATSFSRMGADLVVVPLGTLVNITSTLLTVQPTDQEIDAALAEKLRIIPGIAQVAPQRIVRAEVEGRGINLIAFDPTADFTIQPWLAEGARQKLTAQSLIAGERVQSKPGEVLNICGRSMILEARLGTTGVGPFDESYFLSFAALDNLILARQKLAPASGLPAAAQPAAPAQTLNASGSLHHHAGPAGPMDCLPDLKPGQVSAFLLQLSPGASAASVKFAVGQIPGLKIIAGNPVFTSSRQALGSLFRGIVVFAGLLLLALMSLVTLLFSAIVQERYREIGLLRALGARAAQIISIILIEAGLITGLGGLLGLGFGFSLVLVFARSLGFYFASLGVPFAWPPDGAIWLAAVIAIMSAACIGVLGALVPAWRARGQEPYLMIQTETTR
ncbi:ABC transporter permease [Beijerinckiaceae bacterium]|nr:ABC transporter permease [Beijerinckiaceae bacterium]